MSTFTHRLVNYNGMIFEFNSGQDREDVRQDVADYIRFARSNGATVTTLKKGSSWEVQTQANIEGRAVTDDDGILLIVEEGTDDDFEED